MGYGQTLEVLARLHLDGGFRAAFLTEPDRALLPLALSDEERRALSQLDPRSVIRMGRFAEFHRLMRIQEHQGGMIWSERGLAAMVSLRVAFYNPGTWQRLWPHTSQLKAAA